MKCKWCSHVPDDLPRCVDFASAVLKYIDEDNSFLVCIFSRHSGFLFYWKSQCYVYNLIGREPTCICWSILKATSRKACCVD